MEFLTEFCRLSSFVIFLTEKWWLTPSWQKEKRENGLLSSFYCIIIQRLQSCLQSPDLLLRIYDAQFLFLTNENIKNIENLSDVFYAHILCVYARVVVVVDKIHYWTDPLCYIGKVVSVTMSCWSPTCQTILNIEDQDFQESAGETFLNTIKA